MLRGAAPSALRTMVVVAALLVPLTGCGESRDRRDARDGLVLQLVQDADVPEDLARCIVDRFFDDRSDAELAEFFDNPDATEAELDAFAELTRLCADDLESRETQ